MKTEKVTVQRLINDPRHLEKQQEEKELLRELEQIKEIYIFIDPFRKNFIPSIEEYTSLINSRCPNCGSDNCRYNDLTLDCDDCNYFIYPKDKDEKN